MTYAPTQGDGDGRDTENPGSGDPSAELVFSQVENRHGTPGIELVVAAGYDFSGNTDGGVSLQSHSDYSQREDAEDPPFPLSSDD